MKKPHWTSEEIDLLKEHYNSTDKQTLQGLFPDRSWTSLTHKAVRLRVPRSSVKAYLRPRTMKQLIHDDTLYLAGLLDGEGAFTIGIRKSKKVIKEKVYEGVGLTPLISITNTHQGLMKWCSETLGGSSLKSPYDKGNKWKTVRILQIARLLDVKALLEQVIPYLKVKKGQAELLLKFCNLRLEDKWTEHNPKLFDIAKDIRQLNRKGKVTEPVRPPSLFQ